MKPVLKSCAVISCLIISCLSADAQRKGYDAWGYPVLDSVISYLSDKVNTDILGRGERIQLSKRTDGWYFYTVDYLADKKRSPEVMCWSKAKSGYVYKSAQQSEQNEEALAAFKKRTYFSDTRGYSDQPVFGYVGWTRDVFKMYEGKPKLSDKELEALARAYSTDLGYRTAQFGDLIDPSLQFHLGDVAGKMTKAQLDTFRRYNSLAIDAFHRLAVQNPAYETFVGNINVKYANEILSGFLALAYSQSMEEGLKELKGKELYDPQTLTFARNLLNSCDKDGILFTQGDNDTYPLYYLQATKGLRRDVLIVNSSLIGLSIYINFIRGGVFDAAGYPMILRPDEYAGSKLDYLYADSAGFDKYTHVYGINERIERGTLYKNDIAIVDMLNANKWKRPVYFAPSVAPDVWLGLDAYLVVHGFVYRLQTDSSTTGDNYNKPVDEAFTYDFLMKKMDTIPWSRQVNIGEMTVRMTLNEIIIFERAAEVKLGVNNNKETIALLDKMMSIYPEGKIKQDVYFVKVPELYNRCQQQDKSVKIAKSLWSSTSAAYHTDIDNEKLSKADWDTRIRSELYVMQQISALYAMTTDTKLAESTKTEFGEAYKKYLKKKGERD